ncbi:MAG: alpha-L-fucosidase [Lentimicrobium sp.]|nr:alpha-L-fucosidase [Lentimicrobium sp.]
MNVKQSLLSTLVIVLLFIAPVTIAQRDNGEMSWEQLQARPYPQWFSDAKLGIFIHWGVYSVPSYGGAESYAEWFLLGLRSGNKDRVDFVKKNYGENFTYRDFAPLLKAELFDADEWAGIFKNSGAKYIVLVSKHHDGYTLWPSKYAPGWNSVEVGPKRDIVGELSDAVKKQGIRLGLYYSLPEWGNPLHNWYGDPNDSIRDYVEQHMIPQFKELVSTYRPDLIFTDGEWYNSAAQWHARELISWYYQLVGPDAIVNDRWGSGADIGFKTPEYSSGGLQTDRPWAEVRGLGRSFGLNRNEKLSAYMTSTELIHLFARTVAYGGGLIINVGPSADGKIPLLQQERIEDLGSWLKINGEAIYESTKWIKSGEEKPVKMERTDPQVKFNWVRNSPGYPISEDNFSVEWTGFIQPDISGEFTFYSEVESDDGIQLFVDDKLVLSKWDHNGSGTESEAMHDVAGAELNGKIKLEKGKRYPIKINYQEEKLAASVAVYWETKSLAKEAIPQKSLFSDEETQQGDGLKGVYKSMCQHIAYTKNHGNVYAICFEWPGDELELHVPAPPKTSQISLLGREGSLPWKYKDGKLLIDLSEIAYNEIPGHDAWTFRITEMQ